MIFNLTNEFEREKFKNLCNDFYKQNAIVELTKKSPVRTMKQNSYLHLILRFFASEYGITTEEAKIDFFKREVNRPLFERTKVNKFGKEIKILRSTSELNTCELTTAIDRFRNWSSAYAEIYLPDPSDIEYRIHMEQVIDKNKMFI